MTPRSAPQCPLYVPVDDRMILTTAVPAPSGRSARIRSTSFEDITSPIGSVVPWLVVMRPVYAPGLPVISMVPVVGVPSSLVVEKFHFPAGSRFFASPCHSVTSDTRQTTAKTRDMTLLL